MPHITKSKQNLWAQAALARSSRNSSTSRNITRPSTPSQPSGPPTPAVSPTPPDTPDILSDEESNDVQETFENVYLHLPDLSPESPEEEDGYHTDDDLSWQDVISLAKTATQTETHKFEEAERGWESASHRDWSEDKEYISYLDAPLGTLIVNIPW